MAGSFGVVTAHHLVQTKRQPEWPMAAPHQGLWKTHPNHPGSCLPCGVTGVRAETPKHDWGKGLQEVSLLHLHPSPTVPGRGSRGRKLGKTQTVPGPGLWVKRLQELEVEGVASLYSDTVVAAQVRGVGPGVLQAGDVA